MTRLLDVENLTLDFDTDEGRITAVDDVSFSLEAGEIMGLVGESGSGKSVTAKALMKLNASNAIYGQNTKISLNLADGPVDIMSLRTAQELQIVRGGAISMIFQEPMASFAPAITIGAQMVEQLLIHTSMSALKAQEVSIEMLNRVGISDASTRFKQYAFELSGGMRQRVGLARALAVDADVLLMDEPFSAVDEQTRRKFQEDLLQLVESKNKTFIFVTHSIEEAVYVSDQIAILLPRPSRVSEIIRPSNFRAKGVDAIRRDSEYLDIVDDIWTSLRSYVE